MPYIWIFGYMVGVEAEKKFGQKTTCPDMETFFQFFLLGRKKYKIEYLKGILWRFGRTKYFVLWLFEHIDEL